MPPLIRSTCRSMNPPISIAPQNVISPSPWEKCRSPNDRFAPVDEHRVEDPRPCGEVLDVLVAAVLPRRGGAGRLAGDPVELGAGQRCRGSRCPAAAAAPAAAPGPGRCRSAPVSRSFHLASSSADGAVPIRPGWWMPTYEHSGMCREVATSPREVPDHLVGVGEPLGEEAAAVLRGEHAGVAPALPGAGPRPPGRDGPISRMSTISRSPGSAPSTRNGPLSTCTPGQRGVADVVGRVVVLDRAVEPLTAVRAEDVAGLDVHRAGMSGCHRLWPTSAWSVNFFVVSSGKTTFGTRPPPSRDDSIASVVVLCDHVKALVTAPVGSRACSGRSSSWPPSRSWSREA